MRRHELVSDDAIYRDDVGTDRLVEWVTQQGVDLARWSTELAADHRLDADPASVSDIELGADDRRVCNRRDLTGDERATA